ncbi:hypothetical protein DYB36_010687 [Aphanomyces astaci]|uniref:CCHC-type domain-containing protein n=1 Tax=Aphanomyces astaci TaxID=112090 RepID=A0A397A1A6_APHAT|nr:hypothetical protein DYB36_010687 [Aphanomyces astaci]
MSPSMSSYKSPVVLLNEDNWNVWRTYYRGRLMSKGLWYIMSGSSPPSSRGNESSAATDTRTLADDEKAYGLLIESIETSQYECIEHATTANAAYTALSDHHEPKTKVDRLALLSDFYGMSWNMKQEPLPEFLARYDVVLRKLRDSDQSITSGMAVDRLLQLMPWELRHVTHQVMALPTLRTTVAHVRTMLETEYKAALAIGAMTPARRGGNDDRALNARDKDTRTPRREGNCNHCGKEGHWAEECRSKAREERAAKPKGRRKQPFRPKKDNGHQASYAREEYLFTANDTPAHLPDSTAMSVLDSHHQVIVDSGASSHMTGDTSNLRDISDCNRSITVANGTRTVATKKGTMSITTSLGAALHLTDVLLVDGMPSTLLSIPVLMERNVKCGVTFTKGQCKITFDGKPIALATLHPTQRVYLLERDHGDDQAGWTQESQQAPNTPTMSKSELWHQRIGHLPIEAIKQCGALGLGPPSTFPRTNTACECCVISKMAKAPTPKTHNRKFKPGECWVSDTKGPMRTESVALHYPRSNAATPKHGAKDEPPPGHLTPTSTNRHGSTTKLLPHPTTSKHLHESLSQRSC